MSYADDLLDQSPPPRREGFTNYKHWKVVQTGQGGTTNWFLFRGNAVLFQAKYGGTITGVSCDDFESAWPAEWGPHTHGDGPDGERLSEPEPSPRSDARRSQELGRLI